MFESVKPEYVRLRGVARLFWHCSMLRCTFSKTNLLSNLQLWLFVFSFRVLIFIFRTFAAVPQALSRHRPRPRHRNRVRKQPVSCVARMTEMVARWSVWDNWIDRLHPRHIRTPIPGTRSWVLLFSLGDNKCRDFANRVDRWDVPYDFSGWYVDDDWVAQSQTCTEQAVEHSFPNWWSVCRRYKCRNSSDLLYVPAWSIQNPTSWWWYWESP